MVSSWAQTALVGVQTPYCATYRAYFSTECIKGIEYLIKTDNSTRRSTHLALGEWQTLQTQLIPILLMHGHNKELIFQLGSAAYLASVLLVVWGY